MVRIEYPGRSIIFLYTAKALATGLTTIKIRIVNTTSGSKVVDDAAMTEVSPINAPGTYRYTWTAVEGSYAVYMFEGTFASPVWLQNELISVNAAPSSTSSSNYTTLANVRAMHYLFDSTNIPDAAVLQFILEADKEINTVLNLSANMSTADAQKCNVTMVANLYCAIRCASYDSSIFETLDSQKETIKEFKASYATALATLKNQKGSAAPPIAFSPVSNTVSSTWWS